VLENIKQIRESVGWINRFVIHTHNTISMIITIVLVIAEMPLPALAFFIVGQLITFKILV